MKGVDVVNPSGAPPFMVLGYAGEKELIRTWEKKYQTTVFTSGTTTRDTLRALKVKRFVGTSYFRGDINKTYAQYFVDAGFDVLDMAGMDVDFDKVQELSPFEVYRFVKGVFLRNAKARAIYMLGPAWRSLGIIEMLEQDLGIPVIHAVPAQCWDIQRHLHVRQPVQGFGRLIAEMPSP
jgi:maleate isomerase